MARLVALASVAALALAAATASAAQQTMNHIEGRLVAGNSPARNVRVTLVYRDGLRPAGETLSRDDGRFYFSNLAQGDYIVSVAESDDFLASETVVEIRKSSISSRESLGRNEKPELTFPTTYHTTLYLTPKARGAAIPAGVGGVAADVDLAVSADARSRFARAIERRDAGETKKAIAELRAAVDAQPDYYAARLELGRLLRREKRFAEACDALAPLRESAPKRAEPLVELGMSLLALDRREEAAEALEAAVAREETSWTAHLYLGYALVDRDDERAEPHFWRALEINEREAAPAHLALARLANRYGYIKEAIEQLEAYLAVAPSADDARDVRRLAEKLKRQLERNQ